ncbi:peptidylprolyl isomerase [Clostridium sp. 1001271B_151109_B4]|uniref:peptidylprolyl isomerase n=1 Tax=Clostridium sp. 1001271B_151109_B4 TaxID=2787148 RepID=UPI0018AC5F60|nr:peptidylprolyl isomerase [Clostridium sp. 1001271B_151109_B4]
MNKILKVGVVLIGISAAVIGLVGCASNNTLSKEENKSDETWNQKVEAPEELPTATIKIKDYGTVVAELYPDKAPNTVNNFISLANSGFYDGLTFYRIIKGFMIQGGCPEGNGTGGPGYSIKGEFTKNGYEYNDLAHTEGVLSMARANDPDSAGSQFFIMADEATHLNGQYAAFGKVTEGLDIINTINSVKTDSNDKPLTDVIIEEIRVDTKGIEYSKPVKIEE